MSGPVPKRSFLFLQGPHGSFFWRLGQALAADGHAVHRINLNGGDRADWPGPAVDYRGALRGWPIFFDDFVSEHGVTDLILFGDCRPHHGSAHGMASLRNIRVHVVEEGYIRPDFMTFQEDGVNGNSTLPRDPDWYREQARLAPPPPTPPVVPSSFRRRVDETMRYSVATALRWPLYPFYRSHRLDSMTREALGWALRLATREREARRSADAWTRVAGRPYFALPLQLNTDYQLRVHSPFDDMTAALRFVVKSFARSAPADVDLVVKRHPLDGGLRPWRRLTARLARRYGVEDRVHYLGEADIGPVVEGARGVVTVNSTVGTLALNRGIPVAVLGHAVYDVPGIVHSGPLDAFWTAPSPPDRTLYEDFRRVLIDRCLIAGGYGSDEGVALLVESARARLTARLTALTPERIAARWG
ncbi:MAG TPA: capsular biosynthesis protein [Sphingomonas sp.]|jgi:capsular polysaccharide export protein